MNFDNQKSRDSILQRLRKIEGQVRGVQNMIQEDRSCEDIIQQMTSIRAAVTQRQYLPAAGTCG